MTSTRIKDSLETLNNHLCEVVKFTMSIDHRENVKKAILIIPPIGVYQMHLHDGVNKTDMRKQITHDIHNRWSKIMHLLERDSDYEWYKRLGEILIGYTARTVSDESEVLLKNFISETVPFIEKRPVEIDERVNLSWDDKMDQLSFLEHRLISWSWQSIPNVDEEHLITALRITGAIIDYHEYTVAGEDDEDMKTNIIDYKLMVLMGAIQGLKTKDSNQHKWFMRLVNLLTMYLHESATRSRREEMLYLCNNLPWNNPGTSS